MDKLQIKVIEIKCDAQDEHGRTILHTAVEENKMELVKMLIKSGHNVNIHDQLGITPLHLAAKVGNEKIVEFLLENDANINATNQNDKTALYIATMEGHKDVVKLLLAKKAKVNIANEYGWTPLHIAAVNGEKLVAELLIKNGANLLEKDKLGRTPLELACIEEQTAVFEVLLIETNIDKNDLSLLDAITKKYVDNKANTSIINKAAKRYINIESEKQKRIIKLLHEYNKNKASKNAEETCPLVPTPEQATTQWQQFTEQCDNDNHIQKNSWKKIRSLGKL